MNKYKARALISVSDKTGIIDLAKHLNLAGIEIVSTGGTAEIIQKSGIQVTLVSQLTGFPEILGGRVKTLHPHVHGGLLADPTNPDHLKQIAEHNIKLFQIVIVNLYPFENTALNYPDDGKRIVENIDIGGPCLLRAAAKNYEHILVISTPEDYNLLVSSLNTNQSISLEKRRMLAAAAYAHTSQYDYLVSNWMKSDNEPQNKALPDKIHLYLEKKYDLRYGENPHQSAAVYRLPLSDNSGLLSYIKHSGKELSYNNLMDTQAAWSMVLSYRNPAAAVIKHQNPCGAAESSTLEQAFANALASDPVSAFGGIVALNRPVDITTAKLIHNTPFLEVIAAPGFNSDSLELLKRKKNRRLITIQQPDVNPFHFELHVMNNGALVQSLDTSYDSKDVFKVVTKRHPTDIEWADLIFGWTIVRFVRSNAIVCAKDRSTAGVGAGQMSRVDSVQIALNKAGDRAPGSIMASDAFFPFGDSIELAAKSGVTAVIQPGGSKNDSEVIDACDANGIAMVFTGIRHFKH